MPVSLLLCDYGMHLFFCLFALPTTIIIIIISSKRHSSATLDRSQTLRHKIRPDLDQCVAFSHQNRTSISGSIEARSLKLEKFTARMWLPSKKINIS